MPVSKMFQTHKVTPETAAKVKALREKFTELEDLIKDSSSTSREQSVALTNLEQSAMWAVKAAVAGDPVNDE